MKISSYDYSDLRLKAGESFVGQSGEAYFCEESVADESKRIVFCRTLPNGVVFKMLAFTDYLGMFLAPEHKAWTIYLDDEVVANGVDETKKIKDARLRALADTLIGDLLVRAKEDKAARQAANREHWVDKEAKKREALKKLDQ
jgi:hypothetical protein